MLPASDSGAWGESQEAGLEPATQRFGPTPEEVRNPTLLESDVAPPPAAEAELCAQRLTGPLPGGAKWAVAQGVLGNVVQKLRNGHKNRRKASFPRLLI